MRIDAMSQVAQIYKTNQTKSTEKTQRTGAKDEVQISEVPDVRAEKIAAIKSSMEAGTYEVSSSDFAEKVLEKYMDILSY